MADTNTLDERYAGVLEPDTMLPAQFFAALRQKAQVDGERRLMIAVLEDAVNCFQKQLHATDPKARQLFLDAEEWVLSNDRSWFFSFENVCDTLDLDPDYVREGLRRWRERALRARVQSSAEAPRPVEDPVSALEEAPLRRASGA